MTAATGPTGPTGPVGTILNSYPSYNDLVAAHPSGNQGDAYLAGGELYVWDMDTKSWKKVGNLIGPTGSTGGTGPTGPVGTILNSYPSYNDLVAAHPSGNQGDAYLAGGELYVWDMDTKSWKKVGNLIGPTGPTGNTGQQGPEASSFTIIPFSSQAAPLTYASNGDPTRVSLLGYGYGDGRANLTAADDFSIPISASDYSFDLGNDRGKNRQVVFSLPFDMSIRSIYITVGNFDTWDFGTGTAYPYVQLYSAGPDSNNFTVIEDAVVFPDEGYGPGTVQRATMHSGHVNNLDIKLDAGTRIAIGALMSIDNDPASRTYYLYFTGGIGLTRWVK